MSRFNDTPNNVAFRSLYGAFNNTEKEVLPINEVIERAKCNYEVAKQPLVKVTPQMIEAIKNGQPIEGLTMKDIISSHCATSRQDTNETLGIVGSDYGVVQNAKAFEFIDFLQSESGADSIIETAGALGNGERIYVSCKLGDCFIDDAKKDMVNNYVIFTTSHDGSGAVKIYFTDIRVVCQNTLQVSMCRDHSSDKLVYKHTKYVGERLEEMPRIAARFIERTKVFNADFVARMKRLASEKVDGDYIRDFAVRMYVPNDKLFKSYIDNNRNLDGVDEISTRAKNQIEKLQQSIDFGIGQDMYRGSKLWLLNGVTTLLHNDTVYKSEEDEFTSLMVGNGYKKLELANRLLEVA